jgi:predicted nucleotidyltransferase
MSTTIERLRQLREEILLVAQRFGATNLRLFGSAARDEDSPESDIDLLVELEAGRTLLDLVALEGELSQLLNRKVDIVLVGGINRHLEHSIVSEAIAI